MASRLGRLLPAILWVPVSSAPAPASPLPCFRTRTVYQPLDMPGVARITTDTAGACQARCRKTKNCSHFTWYEDNGCHMQGRSANRARGPSEALSGPRDCADEDYCYSNGFKYHPMNMDDEGRTDTITAEDCQMRCANVEGCASFCWFPDGGCHIQGHGAKRIPGPETVVTGGRDCMPTTTATSTATTKTSTTGTTTTGTSTTTTSSTRTSSTSSVTTRTNTVTTSTTPQPDVCLETGAQFKPHSMKGTERVEVSSPYLCQQRCQRTSGCLHFSWWGRDGGCHLQDIEAAKVTADADVITGPTSCFTTAYCYENRHKWDPIDMKDTRRSDETSPEACQERCRTSALCSHFTYWSDGGCHLQDQDAILADANNDVESGPVSCVSSWKREEGFLPMNHNLYIGYMTPEQARMKCINLGCAGFTYKLFKNSTGHLGENPDMAKVFIKSKWDIIYDLHSSSSGWVSFHNLGEARRKEGMEEKGGKETSDADRSTPKAVDDNNNTTPEVLDDDEDDVRRQAERKFVSAQLSPFAAVAALPTTTAGRASLMVGAAMLVAAALTLVTTVVRRRRSSRQVAYRRVPAGLIDEVPASGDEGMAI